MKYVLLAAGALIMLPLIAYATEPTPSPSPQATPQIVQPNQFTLTVTPEEANQIGDSLLDATGITPRKAMSLLQKIRNQVSEQVAEATKKGADTTPPKPPEEPVK